MIWGNKRVIASEAIQWSRKITVRLLHHPALRWTPFLVPSLFANHSPTPSQKQIDKFTQEAGPRNDEPALDGSKQIYSDSFALFIQ